jgi:hypothetical protein
VQDPEVDVIPIGTEYFAELFHAEVVDGDATDVEFYDSCPRQCLEETRQRHVARLQSLDREHLNGTEPLHEFGEQPQRSVREIMVPVKVQPLDLIL